MGSSAKSTSLTIFEGQLTYETLIIDVEPGSMPRRVGQYSPEMARVLARFNTSTKKVVTFSGSQYRSDQDSIDFGWKGPGSIIWDEDKQKGFECKAMQFAKVCFPYEPDDFEEEAVEPEIHFLEETEKLLDYTCRKALYHLGDETWEIWFTEEVEIAAPSREMITKEGIAGVILKIREVADPNSILIQETCVTHFSKEAPANGVFDPPQDYTTHEDIAPALEANHQGLISMLRDLEDEPVTDFTGYWKLNSPGDEVFLEVGFDEEGELWHQVNNLAMDSSHAEKAEIHGPYLIVPRDRTYVMYSLDENGLLSNLTYSPLSFQKTTLEEFQTAQEHNQHH